MIEVRQATTPQELDDVRALITAFVVWHRARHVEDLALIDRYFDPAAFEEELETLPGKYAPPKGSVLIAYDGETPVGCVAMRDLGDGVCEMKRMYVPEAGRGRGVGALLCAQIIADARAAGYRLMRLDTSKRQTDAIRLYERAGFVRTAPYYEMADDVRDWLVFFELAL